MKEFSPETSAPEPGAEPTFVSQQVSGARRYYLDLNPAPQSALTVVCGGVERMTPEYMVSRTQFPFYGIEMVTEGAGKLELDGNTFSLQPGVVFAYGPRTHHRIWTDSVHTMRKYYIDIAGRQTKRRLTDAGLLDSKPLRVIALHEFVEIFESLDREARSDSEWTPDVCRSLAELLMLKIRQRRVGEGQAISRAYDTYRRVRDEIEENYMELRTAEDVAAKCDLSPIHVSRLFKRFGGVGAYQFLLRKKMNHAAELLIEERLLVKEVADRLGFSDAFQFSRAFKRVYGIPPKELTKVRSAMRASVSDD
ncbi:AraC family transcriptional regulator [Aporhodopirellula aestuarii]|uniref:AraC family transcriptional regulator n=1 Tax=Aporhodopirellula aestuarii TaxID=2950107 RepID=A0ABT0TXI7_9BACT|nr:AraC family transcriptional regulator [Aporhodopirellula aestuarii]MCM2369290.1 AraC family transcriptional regulator [Aporhodopirellula aestuarii]